GGGRSRMLVTLVFFCVGSVIGTAHLPWWLQQYSLGSISLSRELGALGAIALQWAVFGAIVLATVVVERRRHGRLEPILRSDKGRSRLLRGPWPLLAGAVLLAGLNVATLALAGHPWGVSSGYTLWGAKAASALGVDLGSWTYWATPGRQRQLEASVFANTISVMNFGIIVGAFLAAGLAGRFAPERRIPWPSLLAAAIGGLLMGYGARLAFGCNVGAYFSGIASGSLHGWLWFLAALVGSYLGTRLRPAFGLLVERSAPCRT
nr:YeeE/YedE family protein [Kiloniellales bacterium]